MVVEYLRQVSLLKRNSGMFFQLFRYYFVIVTLIISLVVFLVYDRMKVKSYKEVGDLNIEIMNLLNRSMDEQVLMKIVDSLSAKLNYENTHFYDFITADPRQDMQNVGWLIQDLKKIRLSNEFIESIYLYRKDIDYIVSTDGNIGLKNMQDTNFMYRNIFDLSWMGNDNIMVQPFAWTGSHRIRQNSKGSGQTNVITYISNFPFGNLDSRCQLIVNIYEEKVNGIISNFNPEIFSNVTILNGDGEIISSGNRKLTAKTGEEALLDINHLKQFEGYFLRKYNHKVYFISYTTSSYNGWKFVSVIPYDTIFSSLIIMRGLLVIIGLIVWMTGLCFSFFIAVRLFIPLNRIKNLSEELAGELATEKDTVKGKNKKESSIDVIGESLFFAKAKANKLKHEHFENMPIIMNSLFSSLILNEKSDYGKVLEKINSMDIRLYNGENRIVAFQEEKYSSNREIDIRQVDSMRNVFIEAIKHGFNKQKNINVFSVWINDDCGIIVLNGSEGTLNRNDINQVFDIVIQECLKSHEFLVTLGISEVKNDLSSFNLLYKEALKAVKLQCVYGNGILYYYEDLARIDETVIKVVSNQKKDLAKFLNLADYERCKEVVDNFMEVMLERKYTYSEGKQMMLDLFMPIARYVESRGAAQKEIKESKIIKDEFMQIENIYEFKERILDLILRLIESGEKEQVNKTNDIVGKMKDHIVANAYNDITIEMIAYQLHFNPSYLRKIFKETEGISFSDYVFNYKMDKAKELLINTNMKIEDIAQKLNYCTSFYFIRKFKEFCGMTPRHFRIMNSYNEPVNKTI